ncbi:MAG TPA: MFS transporter [Chloroflexota bacterium]|nr:MFS transporter [Chloroflexota bacterium]
MPALPADSAPVPAARVDYRRAGLLSIGHLTNDLYGNLFTSLTPYLVIRGVISLPFAGLVVLLYLLGSSVLQPVFGVMSDRSGRRLFAVAGPLWVGVSACLLGWAGGPAAVLGLGAVGGIGTAAFHPQAASMIDRLSGRSKAWVMSIFSMGGNLGFAFGPLLAAAVAQIGLHYSPLLIIPGVAVTALLALYAPPVAAPGNAPPTLPLRSIGRETWRRLTFIVSTIAARSSVQSTLIIFLPLFYHARGFSAEQGSYYAFVLSLCGAVGGLFGGRLADRYGRRLVVIVSLLLTVPLLLVALLSSGLIVWLLLGLGGAALLASNSVTVVQGQELLPRNTGMASGLTLGLGFGLSGAIGSLMAVLAARFGVVHVIYAVPFLALIAALLAWFVPDRADPLPVTDSTDMLGLQAEATQVGDRRR